MMVEEASGGEVTGGRGVGEGTRGDDNIGRLGSPGSFLTRRPSQGTQT